jgi:hypothetical protein
MIAVKKEGVLATLSRLGVLATLTLASLPPLSSYSLSSLPKVVVGGGGGLRKYSGP